jgi:iron complex outermembrane receptor protein
MSFPNSMERPARLPGAPTRGLPTPSTTLPMQANPLLRRAHFGAHRLVPVLAALALAFAVPARAQQATGTVTGSVLDVITGKFLEGADVAIEGTRVATTTEREGRFTLRDVPAGPQRLVVSYPGLEAKATAVTVTAGQTAALDVRLGGAGDVVTLEAFKVAGAKEGMSQAIALQKASFNQKLVAASDQFGDISEGNVGEYLKFLPGIGIDYTANDARAVSLRGMNPIFTNVTVDGGRMASGTSSGDSRRFELEQVAINNVETIEVFKTMTPDMSADNTGGQVNLVTKSAFDREARSHFSYNLSLTANNDNLTFSKRGAWGEGKKLLVRPNADLNFSRRVSDKVGINISYRLSEVTHDYPRAGYSWNFSANGATLTNPYLASLQMYDEQKITHRESFSTKVDFRPAPRTKLALTGQWNWYDLTFNGRSITFNSGTPAAGFTPNRVVSTAGTGNVTTDVSQRSKYGPTYVLGLQFSHEFESGKLWGGLSWSQAENKYRDTTRGFLTGIGLNLLRPAGSNTVVTMDNILNQLLPTISVTQTGATPNFRDLSSYSIGANQWRTRPFTSRELKEGLSVDYRRPFKFTIPVALQVGIRRDDTGRKIKRLGVNNVHPALTGAQLEAYRDDDYSDQDIGFGFGAVEWLSPYKTYDAFPGMSGTFTENVIREIEERNDAAYVRFDLNLTNQFTVVTGARYEKKNLDASAQDLRVVRQRLTTAHLDYDGWYPSVNLKYTPQRDIIVRAGASRTIGHPDFADIIPTVTDFDSSSATSTGTLSIPNPNIQPYKVTNLDLTGEWYLPSTGVISASLFQKKVDGFISRGSVGFLNTLPNASQIAEEYGISTADQNRYSVTLAQNGAGSTVKGLEVSYAQGLSFLPKPFHTMNVQLNFTKVNISGDTFGVRLAQLQGATTKSANAIVGWRVGRFNFLTTVNYTGEVETGFGTTGTAPSTFNEAVTKTDITVNYALHRRATIYLQVRNIFGEGRAEFQTPSDPALFKNVRVPSRYSEYGDPIFYLGVRGTW